MNAPVPVWRHPDFRRGVRDMTGVSMGIAAWGLVSGVAMVKSGLGVGLSLLMSFVVFAGGAQLASLPLIAHGAPLWVIWMTAACVNLRFVIFSAGWRRYFGSLTLWHRLRVCYFAADLNYVTFLRRFPEPENDEAHLAYFWGGVAVGWTSWQALSIVGIVLADVVPTAWGLGFAGTLALLGITGTMLVDRGTWVAAAVAGCAAIAAFALPYKLDIVVAIAAAVAVGVLMDHFRPPAPPKAPERPKDLAHAEEPT
jgi:predicted branched-subunit amino acid permease